MKIPSAQQIVLTKNELYKESEIHEINKRLEGNLNRKMVKARRAYEKMQDDIKLKEEYEI